jgi:hypothetical protein
MMNNDVPNNKDDIYFEYLDDLRDSGATNMYAAVPYIVEKFGLSMSEATDVLVRWMESYSDRHYYGY